MDYHTTGEILQTVGHIGFIIGVALWMYAVNSELSDIKRRIIHIEYKTLDI